MAESRRGDSTYDLRSSPRPARPKTFQCQQPIKLTEEAVRMATHKPRVKSGVLELNIPMYLIGGVCSTPLSSCVNGQWQSLPCVELAAATRTAPERAAQALLRDRATPKTPMHKLRSRLVNAEDNATAGPPASPPCVVNGGNSQSPNVLRAHTVLASR